MSFGPSFGPEVQSYGSPDSRQRREEEDERKLWLKRPDELIVGSSQFSAFALGECDVETVVDADPGV